MTQRPYDWVQSLNADVEISGDRHEYFIPSSQLLSVHCKRGPIWGELEFVLLDSRVIRLHGAEWSETQRFYHHLQMLWEQWGAEVSDIAAGVLKRQLATIERTRTEGRWLTRQQMVDMQDNIRQALTDLPMPTSRLEAFDDYRELRRECQRWLGDIEATRLAHDQAFTGVTLKQYRGFFDGVKSPPLNASQARMVVNGEHSPLALAGAGSGRTSVLAARVGQLLAREEAAARQILLLAFGRQAAQEMGAWIRERLASDDIAARTLHSLALYIIQQGSKKVPIVNRLENDSVAHQALLVKSWQQQCQEEKARAKDWCLWLKEEVGWQLPEGNFWQDKKVQRCMASRLDRWVSLIRVHGGSQAEMIAGTPETVHGQFSKRMKLMSLLTKEWKTTPEAENAVDFSGLIYQTVNTLDKDRFISLWKHILVDEFQDISSRRASLLVTLRRQNS